MTTPAIEELIAFGDIETAIEANRELLAIKAKLREQGRLIEAMGDKMRIMAESLTKCAESGK